MIRGSCQLRARLQWRKVWARYPPLLRVQRLHYPNINYTNIHPPHKYTSYHSTTQTHTQYTPPNKKEDSSAKTTEEGTNVRKRKREKGEEGEQEKGGEGGGEESRWVFPREHSSHKQRTQFGISRLTYRATEQEKTL
jgi:hypothetical protein